VKIRLFAIISIALLITGCYVGISGRVIDAETQQPVEGAVVLVEWTKKHGWGDAWTESYKVVEVISDKDGNVSIDGCYSPFVRDPDVTVYKKGYVAWNNRILFPSSQKRKDFQWEQNYIFQLSRFKSEYSHDAHVDFIRMSINSSINSKSKRTIKAAFEWEADLSFQEREY